MSSPKKEGLLRVFLKDPKEMLIWAVEMNVCKED